MYNFGKIESKKKVHVCMDAYTHTHTHTHTLRATHLYSRVIRHLAYGFNSC